jgi:hypothetical protein
MHNKTCSEFFIFFIKRGKKILGEKRAFRWGVIFTFFTPSRIILRKKIPTHTNRDDFLRHQSDGNLIWDETWHAFFTPRVFRLSRVSLEGENGNFSSLKCDKFPSKLSDRTRGEIKTFNIQWSNTMSIYYGCFHFVCWILCGKHCALKY